MKRLVSLFVLVITLFAFTPFCTATAAGSVSGVWVSTVGNLDFPSEQGLSKEALKSEIDSIISSCKKENINTIFFQVRPNSDALYPSKYFPWSEVLSGTQGIAPADAFDPLSYIISKAHSEGISLHAWINPYRIGEAKKVCAVNPASKHPEWTVLAPDGKLYYNPAIPEARQLILDGISEIIENYDVDGIHFDDYFYPYDVESFDDSKQFEASSFSDIGDFRRANVNELVKSAYTLVHNKSSKLKFGISPFGIWANKSDSPEGSDTSGMSSYSAIYSDSRYWVQNKMVDYICPQIYWSFENSAAPFETLVRWWDSLCKNSGVDLYIGIALYKCGTDELGWRSQNQIPRQLSLCLSLSSVSGTVFFRYGCLPNLHMKFSQPQATAPFTSTELVLTGPVNNYKTEGSDISITGVCDPSKPLSVNNTPVFVTEHGYFSAYVSLKNGKNTFTLKNGDNAKSLTVHRVNDSDSKPELLNGFVKNSAAFEGDAEFFSGECITLSVMAEAGLQVFARINNEDLLLTPQSSEGVVKYLANYLLPVTFSKTNFSLQYVIKKDESEFVYPSAALITVISKPVQYYTVADTYLYDDFNGGSMMDNYQLPKSTPVLVNARVGEMSRLTTGMWVYTKNLSQTYTKPEPDINTQKYIKTSITLKSPFTFNTFVTESGTLCVDVFHAYGEKINPKTNSTDISLETVKLGSKTRVIISKHASAVTGFYTVLDNNTLDIYVYHNSQKGIYGKTIVLDAGHGGDDVGALGPAGEKGATESDLNLALAYALKQKLESKGAKVILTRTDDSLLLLDDRAELIRSYYPDLCISLHHNSVARESDYSKATGTLTLYSRETSAPLAKMLSNRISFGTGIVNKGANTQSLNVCRDYRFPCVLLECGFVCNPQEYELLLTENYKNTVTNNILSSLSDYFG